MTENFVVTEARQEKAAKILAVITAHAGRKPEHLTILDVGAGTGQIIDAFAAANATFAVDVLDQRSSKISRFQLVADEALPYPPATFDVIISNHVIEHTRDPGRHLAEMRRVIKPDGFVYLATPNRVFPRETHYRLWLLHYLPLGFYHAAARKLGRSTAWFWAFTPRSLTKATEAAGFHSTEFTGSVLADPDRFALERRYRVPLPRAMLRRAGAVAPTLIRVLSPKACE